MTARKRALPSDEITIERVECRTDYTVLPNALLNDVRLKALPYAVLIYLLSKPGTWKVHTNEVRKRFGISRPVTLKAIKELIRIGYVQRELMRDESHKITGVRVRVAAWPKFAEPADGEAVAEVEAPALAPAEHAEAMPDVPAEALAGSEPSGPSAVQDSVLRPTRPPGSFSPVLSNDIHKSPPLPPQPSLAASKREGSGAAVALPVDSPHVLAARPPAHSSGAPPVPKNYFADRDSRTEPRHALAAMPPTGTREEGQGAGPPVLEPITFENFWKHYELRNPRNRAKARVRWIDLALAEQAAAHARMSQYFAVCATRNQRVVEAWKYLGDRVFRALDPARHVPDPKPIAPRLTPMEFAERMVLTQPIGVAAAREGWAMYLLEFAKRHARLPRPDEVQPLRDQIRESQQAAERLGALDPPDGSLERMQLNVHKTHLSREAELAARILKAAQDRDADDFSKETP